MKFFSLDADPVCSANATLSDLVEGECVKLTCSIRYSVMGSAQEQQTWAPVMSWTGPNLSETVDESTLGSVSQYSVTFMAAPVLGLCCFCM